MRLEARPASGEDLELELEPEAELEERLWLPWVVVW